MDPGENPFAGWGRGALVSRTVAGLPGPIRDAGPRASERFLEFFTAQIRNPNTRMAYARAVWRFLDWCDARGLGLNSIRPIHVATYIEQHPGAPQSVKQALAAIRMLFDWLVLGQVLPINPAHSVRGPKYIIKKGKTPVLTAQDARRLLESIPDRTLVGLRDRALIAVMIYSFARVGAVVGMRMQDYYHVGRRGWLRLHEKGGKFHEVPAHHRAEEYLDAYLDALRAAAAPPVAECERSGRIGTAGAAPHPSSPVDGGGGARTPLKQCSIETTGVAAQSMDVHTPHPSSPVDGGGDGPVPTNGAADGPVPTTGGGGGAAPSPSTGRDGEGASRRGFDTLLQAAGGGFDTPASAGDSTTVEAPDTGRTPPPPLDLGPRSPLFRAAVRWRTDRLSNRPMTRSDVLRMVKRRAMAAGLPRSICCHTFRATGITVYLENGGSLEHAQAIAAHESPRTTKLYDRTGDQISLDEIERIRI